MPGKVTSAPPKKREKHEKPPKFSGGQARGVIKPKGGVGKVADIPPRRGTKDHGKPTKDPRNGRRDMMRSKIPFHKDPLKRNPSNRKKEPTHPYDP
jgi:hypothetical protein